MAAPQRHAPAHPTWYGAKTASTSLLARFSSQERIWEALQ